MYDRYIDEFLVFIERYKISFMFLKNVQIVRVKMCDFVHIIYLSVTMTSTIITPGIPIRRQLLR